MPYGIPSSTKTLAFTAPFLFILLGALSIWEFAMVPGVYILLCPQGRKGTLFFLHIQLHDYQQHLNPCLWLYYYGKVIVELEKTETRNLTVFMVLVI